MREASKCESYNFINKWWNIARHTIPLDKRLLKFDEVWSNC